MTDKELRKMTRSELLELLIVQMEENEILQKKLDEAVAELDSRHLAMVNAGSLAEAALQINGVFEAAEAAAQQYLYNVRSAPESDALVSDGVDNQNQQVTEAEEQQVTEAEEQQLNNADLTNVTVSDSDIPVSDGSDVQQQQETEECEEMSTVCEAEHTEESKEVEKAVQHTMDAKNEADGDDMLARIKEEIRKLHTRAAEEYKKTNQD